MDKNKRGQEELVGFVVIVLLVSIAGIFIIGVSLRTDSDTTLENSEVKQVLKSMFDYTGQCSIGTEGYQNDLKNNLIACASDIQATCLSGQVICTYLKGEMTNILNIIYPVAENAAVRGYIFVAESAPTTSTTTTEIFKLIKGNCSGSYRGDNILFSNQNSKIRSTLRVCY